MAKYRDKTILITGGAAGIGCCIAKNFAKDGSRLILTDVNAKALADTKAKLVAHGAKVDTYVVNVADQKQVEKLAADVLKKYGRLDVLINNAGVGYMGEIATTPIEQWRRLMDVDFWGVLYHTYAFLPSMIKNKGGQIINVSSGQAFFQLPTWGPYAAIKAALGVFSEVLHWEVRKYGVKVTTVYPYMVNTGLYDDIQTDTVGGKLSMMLLPLYSQSPETVGKIIYKAVKSGKHVEMVNVLNTFAKYARAVSPVGNMISFFSDLFLTRSKSAGGNGQTAA
jgi:short-subunit dehydrogenase